MRHGERCAQGGIFDEELAGVVKVDLEGGFLARI